MQEQGAAFNEGVYMNTVVDKVRQSAVADVKICIGGAPVGPEFAKQIGADGYAADAASAVQLFKELTSSPRREAQPA